MEMQWRGVIPAITTPFRADLSIDHEFMAGHCRWLIESGCTGLVALGSLGEGGTLGFEEKRAVLRTCVAALGSKAPVIAGVAALSTAEAIDIARMAQAEGCCGLMVLPPYVYLGDWRELRCYVEAVLAATALPCMLYNNPLAYRADFLPEHIVQLLEICPNLAAVKESSADVRRIAALRALAGDRLAILCGVDDLIVEAARVGASGWIAGLANAYPRESVELFDRALHNDVFPLYHWFLPLLRMDTVPKFVQLIKLVQEQTGMGFRRVRPPRLELTGPELDAAIETVRNAERR